MKLTRAQTYKIHVRVYDEYSGQLRSAFTDNLTELIGTQAQSDLHHMVWKSLLEWSMK